MRGEISSACLFVSFSLQRIGAKQNKAKQNDNVCLHSARQFWFFVSFTGDDFFRSDRQFWSCLISLPPRLRVGVRPATVWMYVCCSLFSPKRVPRSRGGTRQSSNNESIDRPETNRQENQGGRFVVLESVCCGLCVFVPQHPIFRFARCCVALSFFSFFFVLFPSPMY